MKVVALLPMKANSERVKGKNFKIFGGKPLFFWMLDKLLSIEEIDQVVINTDARDFLSAAGVTDRDRLIIRDRPTKICGDFVSMNVVIEDDLKNTDADVYLMTHTTNPLLKVDSIKSALRMFETGLEDNTCDSLFTVCDTRERFYDLNGNPLNHDPSNLVRTQDLDPIFRENSNLYLFTKKSFARTQARIGTNPIMFVTKPIESTDIDTPEDWDLAETILEFYKKQGVSFDV